MSSFGPVMSSMFIVVQLPDVSLFQAMLQDEPGLNTSPGAGVKGAMSAITERIGNAARTKMDEIILFVFLGKEREVEGTVSPV